MENNLGETAVNKDMCEIGSLDQLTEDVLKVPVHLLKEEIVQGKVLHHAEEHLLGEADHNEKTSGLAIQFISGNDHTKDNREAFVHDPVEKHNGYSPKGLIDSAVINDHKNTKDDQLPEDVHKVHIYHIEEHLLGEADHNIKTSGLAVHFLPGLIDSVVIHNSAAKPSGYSLKCLLDIKVEEDLNDSDHENIKENADADLKVPVHFWV